ncbi:MAG: zinc-ribbon domain-containing protein, partial [Candidatus Hodarchaeota archaeon]
ISEIKYKCGKCGAKLSPGYDFCLSCGTKFSEIPPSTKTRSSRSKILTISQLEEKEEKKKRRKERINKIGAWLEPCDCVSVIIAVLFFFGVI